MSKRPILFHLEQLRFWPTIHYGGPFYREFKLFEGIEVIYLERVGYTKLGNAKLGGITRQGSTTGFTFFTAPRGYKRGFTRLIVGNCGPALDTLS